MPIRINLLAEQQALEELKRQDPIKRAIWIGVALTILMMIWIGMTQMTLKAKEQQLSNMTNELYRAESKANVVRTNEALLLDAEYRIRSLERYGSNRFLWGTFLGALQQAALPEARLTELEVKQVARTNPPIQLIPGKTNLILDFKPPPAKWKFWTWFSGKKLPDFGILTSNAFNAITNQGPFMTNKHPLVITIVPKSTNTSLGQYSTTVDFSTVPFAVENTTITIRGKEYGDNIGKASAKFVDEIKRLPYFKMHRLKEGVAGVNYVAGSAAQARLDPTDQFNTNQAGAIFTVTLTLEERVFYNE